jgi:SpoVK/Ycf46/Vps4 family AAA+-type ATPase
MGIQGAPQAAAVVREAARSRLGDLVELLECPFEWDDLVVPETIREVLEDLVFEARDRAAFWENPRACRLFPQGSGLFALFAGATGSGKTMAPRSLRAALKRDLFRIDLSGMVSQYIGETSKNLNRALSVVPNDEVLLFDEADVLFGKRTEVHDAHDRYANTDTNYLLQAIEVYRGVALLATNRKADIDPAIIRRLRFVVDFPRMPNAESRPPPEARDEVTDLSARRLREPPVRREPSCRRWGKKWGKKMR